MNLVKVAGEEEAAGIVEVVSVGGEGGWGVEEVMIIIRWGVVEEVVEEEGTAILGAGVAAAGLQQVLCLLCLKTLQRQVHLTPLS